MTPPTVLWFRRDLRVADHPALLQAAVDNASVLGVFVADEALLANSGAPRRAFLAGCLERLSESLGGRLLIVFGRPDVVVPRLAAEVGASSVHISADYGPYGQRRDQKVERSLGRGGVELVATGSPYAVAPGRVRKADGTRYAVFTPYFRGWSEHGWRGPARTSGAVDWIDPNILRCPGTDPLRRIDPAELSRSIPDGMTLPEPGEAAARQVWRDFLGRRMDERRIDERTAEGTGVDERTAEGTGVDERPADERTADERTVEGTGVDQYQAERDRPDHRGTSRISPYLKWGCIHPRTQLADLAKLRSEGAAAYRRELAWREFYADVVFHLPHSLWTSVDPVIDRMSWDRGDEADRRLEAWKTGTTGYPYIDAGMRQLLAQGWMHNRVRMGVASFLIKDLHVPWQAGAAHFMEHLVDGDIASNNHGWQWVAGSGAQASPFFRVFNPITQGEKFDPHGDYVRQYIPELRAISGKTVHRPWELGIHAPQGYPQPIVEHAAERVETLRRWESRPRA